MVGMVDRYMNDPQIRALVQSMIHSIETLNFTPSEIRDCAMLAATLYEQRHFRRFAAVENSNSAGVDAVVAPPTTGSPKLPTQEECIANLRQNGGLLSQEERIAVKLTHGFICRQLRADA